MKSNTLVKGMAALMVMLVLVSSNAIASAGKVIYGYGNNYAMGSDGKQRKLAKGAKVYEGDTLVTGRGRLHILLRDKGFVSIYPNSEYRIDKFHYPEIKNQVTSRKKSGDHTGPIEPSKEDRSFFSLLKGAARQVTGYIGRKYNENFRFKTTVATIGIRGTGFFARLCDGDCVDADGKPMLDGLYVKNNTGVITMKTHAGEIVLSQGQSAFSPDIEDVPEQVLEPPVAYNKITPVPERYDFDDKVNDDEKSLIDSGGNSSVVSNPVVPGQPSVTNLARMDYASNASVSVPFIVDSLDATKSTTSIVQNGNSIVQFSEATTNNVAFDKNTASLSESGVDNFSLGVLWNRWTGNFTMTASGVLVTVLDNNIHIIGSNNITQALPTSGVVNYTGVNGTSPTISGVAGNQVGTQTVSATVDFGLAKIQSMNVTTTFNGAQIVANNSQSPAIITSPGGTQIMMSGFCTGTGCGAGGSVFGDATVTFVGQRAEGVFGSYNLVTTNNAVSGSYFAVDQNTLTLTQAGQ